MNPSIGRIVTYTLTEDDARAIAQRSGHKNMPHAGEAYPAMVVRTWPDSDLAQLQVFYDGDGAYWATSRGQGVEPGNWHWPVRV